MKKEKKRRPIRSRKRAAIRQAAIALTVILLVNHIMHIGVLLPRWAYHELEERTGAGWTRVVARDWVPELHKTHIAYLSGDETATVFGSVYLTLYGWMPNFSVALDCAGDAPLYAGCSFMSREEKGTVWYFFGRVDDPAITSVAISLCAEEYDEMSHAYVGKEVRRISSEELIEKGNHRYFLLRDGGAWPEDAGSSPRPVVIGCDATGKELVRMEIETWNSAHFG